MREWNEMPKDIKKFYHNIADQEKKKQKNSKNSKETIEMKSVSKTQKT